MVLLLLYRCRFQNFLNNLVMWNNLTIFLHIFSTSFWRNSTRKIVKWFEELTNFNHLTIFITEFYQKLVEKFSKTIQLSLSHSSLLNRNVTLPWATSCHGLSRFFLNQKKINIFRLMHIALFVKVMYWIQILLTKKIILYCFSYKVTFSMSKVNFWFFSFIETKSTNINSLTNEN